MFIYMKIIRLPKLLFRNPIKNKVVIFDGEGSIPLREAVLNGISNTIVHARRETLYITFQILYLMLKSVVEFARKKKKLHLRGTKKPSIKGCVYRIYLYSCIKYIRPKVVLTFIDNSLIFQWLSRTYDGCEFYAVQNGIRNDAKRMHYNDSEENYCSRSECFSTNITSMPNLFCFGQYEDDLYKKHNNDVDNFYPVGSLRGGFYKTCRAGNNVSIDFDICLVSDNVLSFSKGHALSKFDLGLGYLHKLVHKYITEEHVSCCIALRSIDKHDQEVEKEYFVNIFGDSAQIVIRDGAQIVSPTYDAMDRSSVVVALNSTTTFEAFGWGKKVLLCNLSGDDFYQSPLPEICTMNVNDYEIFKTKLNYLRQIDESEYRELTRIHAQYLMNYDFENPPHIVIRKMILEHLEGDGTRG